MALAPSMFHPHLALLTLYLGLCQNFFHVTIVLWSEAAHQAAYYHSPLYAKFSCHQVCSTGSSLSDREITSIAHLQEANIIPRNLFKGELDPAS